MVCRARIQRPLSGFEEAQGPHFGPGAAAAALRAIDRELQIFSRLIFSPSNRDANQFTT
jgi:hypothetical protein